MNPSILIQLGVVTFQAIHRKQKQDQISEKRKQNNISELFFVCQSLNTVLCVRECVFLKLCCITLSCYLSPQRVRVKTSAAGRTNPCSCCPIEMLGFFIVYCWVFFITMVTCCSVQRVQSVQDWVNRTIKFYPFTG